MTMKSFNHSCLKASLFCAALGFVTLCAASNDKVEVIQGKGGLLKGASGTSGTRLQPNNHRLDQDGNKKLSMNELLAEHQRQIEAFVQADKNKDGELSAAERKVFKKSIKLKSCAKQ